MRSNAYAQGTSYTDGLRGGTLRVGVGVMIYLFVIVLGTFALADFDTLGLEQMFALALCCLESGQRPLPKHLSVL